MKPKTALETVFAMTTTIPVSATTALLDTSMVWAATDAHSVSTVIPVAPRSSARMGLPPAGRVPAILRLAIVSRTPRMDTGTVSFVIVVYSARLQVTGEERTARLVSAAISPCQQIRPLPPPPAASTAIPPSLATAMALAATKAHACAPEM